jgi:hypothetical protein
MLDDPRHRLGAVPEVEIELPPPLSQLRRETKRRSHFRERLLIDDERVVHRSRRLYARTLSLLSLEVSQVEIRGDSPRCMRQACTAMSRCRSGARRRSIGG